MKHSWSPRLSLTAVTLVLAGCSGAGPGGDSLGGAPNIQDGAGGSSANNGGSSAGGSVASGGSDTTTGGSDGNTGGSNNTGGSDTGTGGVSTGGTNTGGSSTGGTNTGGSSTGGANTGGSSTGGANTGGSSTGGSGSGTPPAIIFSEVESNGGTPGDWAELYNPTGAAVDLSGWKFLDGDDTHAAYVIPASTIIEAGAYFVLDESQFVFGLGKNESVRLFAPDGTLVTSYSWADHAVTTYGRCPTVASDFTLTTSSTKGAANDCSLRVKINEVESNGGSPDDWVELYNAGPLAADISGWVFKDNDDTHSYIIPAATVIAPGAYLVLDTGASGFSFGLGGADSARLFDGTTLVDSYTWAAHATTTYGRCPNGTGDFATTGTSTKGTANDCGGGSTGPIYATWPGQNNVTTVDGVSVFGSNLSGLTYQAVENQSSGILWGVQNGPSKIYQMTWDGSIWTSVTSANWSAGKTLVYTNGGGAPDTEDLTFAEVGSPFVYVATERDNNNSAVSHPAILRFDTSDASATLTATHEWNLTANLPAVGANLGLEAITWIPDSFLTSRGFYEGKAKTYAPSDYANHGTGLFFVGLEANGTIYAYALDLVGGGFSRVATILSGQAGVMSLDFDRETHGLWANGDDSLNGQSGVLGIDQTAGSATLGRFIVKARYARPSTMPNINNEGFTITPEAECSGGFKPVYWADDSGTGTHSIRKDSIACGGTF